MDFIKQLGTLAFGTRLRRLTDRLMRDVSKIYGYQNVNFHARWFTVTYLLTQKSPLSITEIADLLNFSHPAINQIVDQMIKNKLLITKKDKKDKRRRLVRLSKKGNQTVQQLTPVWQIISDCTAEVINIKNNKFLESIEEIENNLDEKCLYDRVIERLQVKKEVT